MTLINSTVANNSALFGGGLTRTNSAPAIIIQNTIVANNSASLLEQDILGAINSNGNNLIEDIGGVPISGTTTGNIIGQDPMLFPLNDYGGPTKTHAPSSNSPVIDQGGSANVLFESIVKNLAKGNLLNQFAPLTNDQRGMPRPLDNPFIANGAGGNASDIGAFEALVPTASAVSVSGRVIIKGKGRAIPFVIIQISNSDGIIQTVRTNHFGRFRFTGIEAGETYVFTIQSKGYQFAPQVINVSEAMNDLIFTPN